MIILMFVTSLALAGVAAWYSIAGLMAIFAASAISIAILGSVLEVSKLVIASWVYRNWDEAPKKLKVPFVAALIVLMTLTSMGIFGYLSKAHLDQAVPTGEIAAKVAMYDEKINIEKEIINESRKSLTQLDTQINETIARTANDTTDKGVRRSIAARKAQASERAELRKAIEASQAKISDYQTSRTPIANDLRKTEAEVGPIKYIAALIYGDVLDQSLLEKAVRIVILMIVVVFDPLAVLMLIAANWSLRHRRKDPYDEVLETVENPPAPSQKAKDFFKKYDSPKEEFKGLESAYDEPNPNLDLSYLKQPWTWMKNSEPISEDEKPLEYDSHGRLMTVLKPNKSKK